MTTSEERTGTCRFCGSDERDEHGLAPIKYGVRHSAHPDCLLKAKGTDTWTLFHDWQLDQFPALAAHRAGLYESLSVAIENRHASRRHSR
jgi:hypothetical protein